MMNLTRKHVLLLLLFGIILTSNTVRAVTITEDVTIDAASPLNGNMLFVSDGDDGATTAKIVNGAQLGGFDLTEESHLVIDGGTVTLPGRLAGMSTLTLLSGAFQCTDANCPLIDFPALVRSSDASEIHVFGGTFRGSVSLADVSSLHVYGIDLRLSESGRTVLGQFTNGEPIDILVSSFRNPSQIVLHESIAEPTTLAMLVAAVALLRIMPKTWRTCLASKLSRCAFSSRILWRFPSIVAALMIATAQAQVITQDITIDSPTDFSIPPVISDGLDGPTTVGIVQGGSLRGFHAIENSKITLNGGSVTFLSTIDDQSQLLMLGGSLRCTEPACEAISSAGILRARDASEFHFFAGSLLGETISMEGMSRLHVYGRSLNVREPRPFSNTYIVTGWDSDGVPFDMPVRVVQDAAIVLHEVPEPWGFVLMQIQCAIACGASRLRRAIFA
jgi:hypothetical protein